MGQGTVKNSAELTNRDINNTQEITRDQTTGMLNGSVTVDHRLLSESGRAEIIQEQQKVLEDVKEIVSNTNIVIGGIKGGIELQTKIEQENKKLNLEDQILFGDFIIELSKSQKNDTSDNYYPLIVAAGEGLAMAAGACARSPACVSATVNVLGAAGLAILNEQSEDKSKAAAPKP